MQKDWFDSNDPPRRPDHGCPAPLPSITDLARHANAVSESTERLYVAGQSSGDDDERASVLFDRDVALRSLLLTFRAITLSDAATQLYAGFLVVDEVANLDMQPADCRRHVSALRRVFLSTLPAVAEAAGLELAEIGGGYIAGYAAREFPAEA